MNERDQNREDNLRAQALAEAARIFREGEIEDDETFDADDVVLWAEAFADFLRGGAASAY